MESVNFNSKEQSDPLALAKNVATYSPKKGNQVKFYNDASDDALGSSGAFHDIVEAIQAARHFIFICDWSFQPGVLMSRTGQGDRSIGQLLVDQAAAGVMVAIHTWNHHKFAPDPDNDKGGVILNEIAQKGGGGVDNRLFWRASARTGVGYTHHQKFVVLDAPVDRKNLDGPRVVKAFFGGLDLTGGRFDWPEHILPKAQDNRGLFNPNDWYTGEFQNSLDALRQPWHDIHAQIAGPAAWDFIYEFVGRWSCVKGDRTAGDSDEKSIGLVWKMYETLRTDPKLKLLKDYEGLTQEAHWSAQVYRSIDKVHWAAPKAEELNPYAQPFKWPLQRSYEASIEDAYVSAIRSANEFIYIESQYFIGSGASWGRSSVKNRIPEAIVNRTLEKIRRKESFHTYVVLPMFPEGTPSDDSMQGIRGLQWSTIKYMIKELGSAWEDYLSFYFVAQWSNQDLYDPKKIKTRPERLKASQRYMIYVHSKLMIVDDKYVIIGSANLNERSLAGDRDTEICVGLWPDTSNTDTAQLNETQAKLDVQSFRKRIWLEHLGSGWGDKLYDGKVAEIYAWPGSLKCIKAVQEIAATNYSHFLRGQRSDKDGHLMLWPIRLKGDELDFGNMGLGDDQTAYIPDYDAGKKEKFRWIPAGKSWTNMATSVTE